MYIYLHKYTYLYIYIFINTYIYLMKFDLHCLPIHQIQSEAVLPLHSIDAWNINLSVQLTEIYLMIMMMMFTSLNYNEKYHEIYSLFVSIRTSSIGMSVKNINDDEPAEVIGGISQDMTPRT
jgi:hypothetical protein